ncbi:hypothetical protein QAD02_000438 [Eretmocerus hayati]|uniref:Uncharacterized protein n=1 Tax=Eretmocerus hayati TaxID=131215 RepID=A0ACC2NDN4_9HYME|nr:hypothetical protein QAD02_000438 [Eretmocerus hayati]
MIPEPHVISENEPLSNESHDVTPNISIDTSINSSTDEGGVLELPFNMTSDFSVLVDKSKESCQGSFIDDKLHSKKSQLIEQSRKCDGRSSNTPLHPSEHLENCNECVVSNDNVLSWRDQNSPVKKLSNTKTIVVGIATEIHSRGDEFSNSGKMYLMEKFDANHEINNASFDSRDMYAPSFSQINCPSDFSECLPRDLSPSSQVTFENAGNLNLDRIESESHQQREMVCHENNQSISKDSQVVEERGGSMKSLSSESENCDSSETPPGSEQQSDSQCNALPRRVKKRKRKVNNTSTESQNSESYFDHVLLETCKILDEHNGPNCTSSDWEFFGENCYDYRCRTTDWQFHGESKNHGGLRSLLKFRCKKCGESRGVWTSPEGEDVLDLNQSAVLGAIAGGFGYAEANAFLSSMDVKFMGEKTFKRHLNWLCPLLEQISEQSMLEAGEEEARLAREAGDIDPSSGSPFTTVIVDGCWLKRSYGNQYNSLSGSGIIIGKRTGKVLFAGIRNKYCCACFRAMRDGRTAKNHDCKRNYSIKKPSTLMESEALIEGFLESVETHGLIYNRFVGDGDSNFYKELLKKNPYREWNIKPEKVECTNHLLRNFCKKLDKITTMKPKNGRKKYYYKSRDVIKKNVMTLRQAVVDAIDQIRSYTELSSKQKARRLKLEIENIPYHVFGDHRGCRKHKFPCEAISPSAEKTINYVPYFKCYGLFMPLLIAAQKLSLNAESLVQKESNNLAENFNNVVCKHVGGKRVNYALSNQYNARISFSVIQFNTHEAVTYILTQLGKKVPECVKLREVERRIKVSNNKQSRAEKDTRRREYCPPDENYGPNAEQVEEDPDVIEERRREHFDLIEGYKKDRVSIELQTLGQSTSSKWHEIRQRVLTASNFGSICRKLPYTSCHNFVKKMLYSSGESTDAMKHGLREEEATRKAVERELNVTIHPSGLHIDPNDPIFACTPDGKIGDDGLVEYKNAYTLQNETPEDAMKLAPHLRFIDPKTNKVKKTHGWFYQVQGQLHITGRQYCYLVLRTQKGIRYERIEKDDQFWKENMEPHLTKFYYECVVPEIAERNFWKTGTIKDSPSIIEAKKRKNERDAAKNDGKEKSRKEKGFNEDECRKELEQLNLQIAEDVDDEDAVDAPPISNDQVTENVINENVEPDQVSSSETDSDGDFIKDTSASDEESIGITSTEPTHDQARELLALQDISSLNSKRNDPSSTGPVQFCNYADGAGDDEFLDGLGDPLSAEQRDHNLFAYYLESKPSTVILTDELKEKIKNVNLRLEDEALDAFVNVVQKTTDWEIESVLYIGYPDHVKPAKSNKSISIIGGACLNHWHCSDHWRVAHFDGEVIHIYDSIKNFNGGKLFPPERTYLSKRYPNITDDKIVYEKINTVQKDDKICGAMAAGLVTQTILKGDLCTVALSHNPKMVRNHFCTVVEDQNLSLFPTISSRHPRGAKRGKNIEMSTTAEKKRKKGKGK